MLLLEVVVVVKYNLMINYILWMTEKININAFRLSAYQIQTNLSLLVKYYDVAI